jgi:hypothetical protein
MRDAAGTGELPRAVEHHHGVLRLLARDARRQLRDVVCDELEDAAAVALADPRHRRLADAAVRVEDDHDGHARRITPRRCTVDSQLRNPVKRG